ncbi:MAG: sigma-70 family RNA polymerase sigma factor [Bacteroidota bacterium]
MDTNDIERHWNDFQKGDESAFRIVVEYYNKRLFYFIKGRVGDTENARELVSKLWERLLKSKSKEIDNLNAYLFRIAKNLILDEYRIKKKALSFETIDDFSGKLGASDVHTYDEEELEEQLKEVLTSQEYLIIQLMVEGYGYKEIADKIGASSSTVANKLTMIRQKLAPWLLKWKGK